MTITLHRAVLCTDDIELYAKIEAATPSNEPGSVFIPTTDPAEIREDIESNIVQFICRDGEPVGLLSTTYDKVAHLYIREFAIVANCQGKGIGGAALRARILPELDKLERIWLEVRLSNEKAGGAYEHLGFVIQKYWTDTTGEVWLIMDLADREKFKAPAR